MSLHTNQLSCRGLGWGLTQILMKLGSLTKIVVEVGKKPDQWITWGPYMVGKDSWVSSVPRIQRILAVNMSKGLFGKLITLYVQSLWRRLLKGLTLWDHSGQGAAQGSSWGALDHLRCCLNLLKPLLFI